MKKLSKKQIENKIKRTPSYAVEKLDSYELLLEATEYEKYDLKDIVAHAKEICTEEEVKMIQEIIGSFEPINNTWKGKGSWAKSGPAWK